MFRMPVDIVIGEDTVTLRPQASSNARIANILGRELAPDGTETLWLDRLVHRRSEKISDGWYARGAISTILTRSARDAQRASEGRHMR